MQTRRHPVETEPAFQAAIAAALPLADLSRAIADCELVRALAIACGDLVAGFSSPPDSVQRRAAHHRAWTRVRELDRGILAARLGGAPAKVLAKAQRAVDRADVLISALPGVLPT
jgi:hypothetical protein